jgi:hypothetical protein
MVKDSNELRDYSYCHLLRNNSNGNAVPIANDWTSATLSGFQAGVCLFLAGTSLVSTCRKRKYTRHSTLYGVRKRIHSNFINITDYLLPCHS